METYKFGKTIYENKISNNQFKQIYEKGYFNKISFDRIKNNPKFNVKFDNNKIVLSAVMVIQREYSNCIQEIFKLIMNKTPPDGFVDKVLKQAKAYGIFCYYKELNNDKIPLPSCILQQVREAFNSSYAPNDYLYKGDCNDTKLLIDFLHDNLNFTYLIYDILETGCISSYVYQRLELAFKTDKVSVKIDRLFITEDE